MHNPKDLSSPIILSVETATLSGSVFLASGQNELATRSGDPTVSHSNSLLSDIRDCLDKAGLKLEDVDAFACAIGPGSFTGLRIGLATLKALAVTLGRMCAGVPTLHAVAHSAGTSAATVALLPAGRGELYAQMFSVSEVDVVKEIDNAANLPPQQMIAKYSEVTNLIWAGEGAHLHQPFLQSFAQQHGINFDEVGGNSAGWKLAPKSSNLARDVAALALRMYQRHELQSPLALKAFYVRPSDAELKERCQ